MARHRDDEQHVGDPEGEKRRSRKATMKSPVRQRQRERTDTVDGFRHRINV